jgi:hypothetical protein
MAAYSNIRLLWSDDQVTSIWPGIKTMWKLPRIGYRYHKHALSLTLPSNVHSWHAVTLFEWQNSWRVCQCIPKLAHSPMREAGARMPRGNFIHSSLVHTSDAYRRPRDQNLDADIIPQRRQSASGRDRRPIFRSSTNSVAGDGRASEYELAFTLSTEDILAVFIHIHIHTRD